MNFRYVALILALLLASCSSWKKAGPSQPSAPVEYVEVPNPMITQGKDAPATIWVPAKAEQGVPRGSVLVQEGVQMAKEGLTGKESSSPTTAVPPPAGTPSTVPPAVSGAGPGSAPTPVPAPAPAARPTVQPVAVKKRIAIVEIGQNGLTAPFGDQVRALGLGVPVDLRGEGNLATAAASEKDRSAVAGELWKENIASVLVVISAPDGVGDGQQLVADIYDGIEKSRLRRVSAQIPTGAVRDKSILTTPCADLALRVGDVVNLTPWYGRIFAVEGERVYLNAGRESGLQAGQKLKVYRGGKVIAGIGFDPGVQIATLEVVGFVGTNGSYGVVRDGQSVNLSDTVSVH